MRASLNDVLSILMQQPDLPQRSPHLVASLGPSFPLVLFLLLLLLWPPLLRLHPRHQVLLPGVFTFPRRPPTERLPWNSTQVDSGIWQKLKKHIVGLSNSVTIVVKAGTL